MLFLLLLSYAVPTDEVGPGMVALNLVFVSPVFFVFFETGVGSLSGLES